MEEIKKPRVWESIDFTTYFNFIKWPVIIALVLEIVLRWWANSLGSGPVYNQMELISWVVRIFAFGFIALRAARNFGYSTVIAAISGVMSGFIVGLVMSLYRFTDGIQIWKFFNIITETLTITVVGSLVAILTIYILSFKNN